MFGVTTNLRRTSRNEAFALAHPTYRIRDWSEHFENNRTRELKELRFVILPNKHDGDGYTELLDHPNGAAHYGAWCAIVQVASKGQHPAGGCGNPAGCCECRGILLREGARPHDPASLSRLTRIPAPVFAEVLPRLVAIGWMEAKPSEIQRDSEIPQDVVTIPHPPAEKCDSYKNGIEQNGIEEKRRKKGARAEKPHDARSSHPALVAVRETKGSFPPKELWDSIIDLIGTHPDVPLLKKCWLTWRTKGYAPTNYGWLVDWYPNGIQGGSNGANRSGRYESATERNARNLKENVAYIRSLQDSGSEIDSQDPIGLLTSGVRHSGTRSGG